MKKVFCLIIALISVMIFSLNAAAAGSVSISQKSDAYKGKSFTVDVILSENPGISRLDVKITYNSKHITLYNASHGSVFPNSGDQSASGSVKLSYSSSGNITDTGRLATIKFNAVAQAGTSTNLTIEVTKALDAAGNDVTFNGNTVPILIITEPTDEEEPAVGDDVIVDDDNISVDEVDENSTATPTKQTESTETTPTKTEKKTEKTKKSTKSTTKATTKATTEPTTTPEPTTSEEPSATPETTTPDPVTEPDSSSDENSEPTIESSTDPDTTSAPENDPAVPESSHNANNDIPYEIPEDYVPASANKEASHKGLIIFGIIAAVAFAVIGGVVIYIRRSV